LACARTATAEQLRLHYVPTGAGGNVMLQAGPSGPPGERTNFFGAVRESSNRGLRPNYLVTFRHLYTGQLVTVPVTFPEGTPRLEYRANRVIYNYGSYTVEASFNPDGSVDMLYNSGFFRPLLPP
jgi:hypothetical protein